MENKDMYEKIDGELVNKETGKKRAINGFTYDQKAYARKSSREDKGGLSKREIHNMKKLEAIDRREALRAENNKEFQEKLKKEREARNEK